MEPFLNGSFNPNWVFSGIVTILCLLVWRMLTKMEKNVEKHAEKLEIHHTAIQLHEQKLEDHENDLKTHRETTRELAEEVVRKMQIAFDVRKL